MPGLDVDITEVLEEVGIGYDIVSSGEEHRSGEFLDAESNSQVTKPFIREFFLEVTFSASTRAIDGDVLQFRYSGDVFGERYIVMNKTDAVFENEVSNFDGVLYKSNVSGELLRPSGETRNAEYQKVNVWDQLNSEAFALQTEPLFGSELEETELGYIGIEKHEMYIPSIYGIQELDRYIPASGEQYKVDTVRQRRYKGVDVVILSEDTRQ